MIQGKIYKIINSVDDSLYIGSTTLDLKLRFYLQKIILKFANIDCYITQ